MHPLEGEKKVKQNLYRNSEGYTDKTAGAAISNVEGGRLMDETRDKFYDGDIVMSLLVNGEEAEFLIVKKHEDYCSTLRLYPDPNRERTITVVSRSLMYTDPGRPGYLYYGNIGSFIKNISTDELLRVRKAVCESFGCAVGKSEEEAPEEIPALTTALTTFESNGPEVTDMERKLIEAEAKLSVYKELYEEERHRQEGENTNA